MTWYCDTCTLQIKKLGIVNCGNNSTEKKYKLVNLIKFLIVKRRGREVKSAM